MRKVLIALTFITVLTYSISFAQAVEKPEPGKIVTLTCQGADNFKYSCFVPTNYNPKKPSPVLYCFSNVADGKGFVEFYQEACERVGWIVVGSLEFRNERFGEARQIVDALWQDTRSRFNVKDKRSYVSGFSGGSLLAFSTIPRYQNNIAGIIGIGTGNRGVLTNPKKNLKIWMMCGESDPLKPKFEKVRDELKTKVTHFQSRHFPGGHVMPEKKLGLEAVLWLNGGAGPGNPKEAENQLKEMVSLFDKSDFLEAFVKCENLLEQYKKGKTVSKAKCLAKTPPHMPCLCQDFSFEEFAFLLLRI